MNLSLSSVRLTKKAGYGEKTMQTNQWIHAAMYAGILLTTSACSTDTPHGLIECVPEKIFYCPADSGSCDNIPITNVLGNYLLKIDLDKKLPETFEGSDKIAGTIIKS